MNREDKLTCNEQQSLLKEQFDATIRIFKEHKNDLTTISMLCRTRGIRVDLENETDIKLEKYYQIPGAFNKLYFSAKMIVSNKGVNPSYCLHLIRQELRGLLIIDIKESYIALPGDNYEVRRLKCSLKL